MRQSSILKPLFIVAFLIFGIVYAVGVMNTGNLLWILPVQPTYEPSRILVREYGETTTYQEGKPGFAELTAALNESFADFTNADYVPVGLGEETLQEYSESAVVVEVYYPGNIRFNLPVRMSQVNQLLIPIVGRHAGNRYVFPGHNGRWLAGALQMQDDEALLAALRDLRHIP